MSQPTWQAPTAPAPVDATVVLPGSKSQTNRALILAALADGPSLVRGALDSRDTRLMAAGLRAIGAGVDDSVANWPVTPGPLAGPAEVDCGLAGTVMRFLPVVPCLAKGPVSFDGDPYARRRPVRPLLDALRQLGATIDDAGRGTLPFTVEGAGGLDGGTAVLDASTSSQYVSALLLGAARFRRGATVRHEGPPVPSMPHIEMTLAMLRERGVQASQPETTTWRVEPSRIEGGEFVVEPDLSNAAPFAAAALATGGVVRFPGWPRVTTQPGDALRGVLESMGGGCAFEGDALVVRGKGTVHGIDIDLRDQSELLTTVAALAAVADSPSTLRGVGHVRGHETDRLAALAKEIGTLGGDVTELDDGLRITPAPLHGGVFGTYDDHRMATAGAVLGLVVAGVRVENIATTAKTMPGFVDLWAALLGRGG